MPAVRRALRQGRLSGRHASRRPARSSTPTRSGGTRTSAACRRSTRSRSTSTCCVRRSGRRAGFGAVRAARQPLPMCRAEVSSCYANRAERARLREPGVLRAAARLAVLPRHRRRHPQDLTACAWRRRELAHVVRVRPVPVATRRLEDGRQPLKPVVPEEDRELLAEHAVAARSRGGLGSSRARRGRR